MRKLAPAAVAVLAFASVHEGLKPRGSASDYAATGENAQAGIGATLLSPDQVRGTFATDLNRAWLVVEIGVYPKAGTKIDLGPGDFMLRIPGTPDPVRPAGPKAIAAVLQKSGTRDRDVTLYPTVGVGYGSGGGWGTGGGVGVGVGRSGPREASTPDDRKTMEQELAEQQLPEKLITSPVAGYLYFPVKTTKASQGFELEYISAAGKLVLPFSGPKRH